MSEQINFNEKRGVPAPPPVASGANSGFTEVNIRTMASDLESLGSGAAPQVKRITIPSRAAPAARQIPPPSFEGTAFPSNNIQTAPPQKRIRFARWFVIIVAAAGGLFLIGYYLLPVIFPPPSTAPSANPPAGTGLPAAPAPTGANLPAVPSSSAAAPASGMIVHQSFFRTAPDQTFFVEIPVVGGASSTAAYRTALASVLQNATASKGFFEVAVRDLRNDDATPPALSWSDFLGRIGIVAYDPGFMQTNFKPDFTAFVYKDRNGFWPGYVAQANSSKNPLLLAPMVMKIESSPASINNLFLTVPGNPSGNFKDAEVSGQPVRTLVFKTPLSAVFAYGWFFNNYLIVSTSLEGLRQAVTSL